MRKLKICEHISLDGVIQHSADDDGFPRDWTVPHRTPAGRAAISVWREVRSSAWPPHRPESLEWGLDAVLGPDIVEDIRGIKSEDGPDLILSGSSTRTSGLLEHGLGDEVL